MLFVVLLIVLLNVCSSHVGVHNVLRNTHEKMYMHSCICINICMRLCVRVRVCVCVCVSIEINLGSVSFRDLRPPERGLWVNGMFQNPVRLPRYAVQKYARSGANP
jgi:hypothetical protein